MVYRCLAEPLCKLRRVKRLEMLRFQLLKGYLAERRQQMFTNVEVISSLRAQSSLGAHNIEPTREVLLNTLAVGHNEHAPITIACHFCEYIPDR
jgi:hypothetical protein